MIAPSTPAAQSAATTTTTNPRLIDPPSPADGHPPAVVRTNTAQPARPARQPAGAGRFSKVPLLHGAVECPADGTGLRRHERLRVQGVASLLLPGQDARGGVPAVLRLEARRGRDRLHVLPDAERQDARRLGGRDVR